jgi:hypothetical protein
LNRRPGVLALLAPISIAQRPVVCREHLDGSGELRILLCRPKPAGERGSSILAACGIYMRDILDACPIDKYFELFKPGEGSEGGFIRISMNYLLPDQVRNPQTLLSGGAKKKK